MAEHSVFVVDETGPVTGLTDITFITYQNISTTSALTAPSLTSAGGGFYNFTPNTANTDIQGVVDTGDTTQVGYYRYIPITTYIREDSVTTTEAPSGTYTITVDSKDGSGAIVPQVLIQVKNAGGSVVRSQYTDSSGSVDIELDAGTFTLVPYKAGWNFTNSVIVVSASATETVTGTAVASADTALTPEDVLDIVRFQVYETSAAFWSDAEIYTYMWQAESEIAQLVECTQYMDDSTTTVSGTQKYAKPLDCLYLKKVEWDSVPLKEMDMQQRDKETHQFQSYGQSDSSGNPYAYWQWGDDLYLYPIPQSAKTLEIWYVRQPAKISASSTEFTVPKEFHNPIVEYCLSRMYLKDQDETRGKYHQEMWLQGVQMAREKWATRKKSNRFAVAKNADNYPQTDLGII